MKEIQTLLNKEEITASLVMPFNGKATTNSLMVARAFGKDHSKVLRDIRKLECSKEFTEANFGLRFYFNKLRNGVVVKCPVYIMTRDGFTFLAMGFTGKVAAKFKEDYINAFNEMERRLREAGSEKELALAARMLDKCIGWLNSSLKSATGKAGAALVPYGDVRLGIVPTKGDFEKKLANMFAQLKCAYLDALSLSGKRLEAEKALERLNRETWLTLKKIR